MAEGRIAIRYAKPLIDLAEEQGELEKVKKDIESIHSLCESSRDFLLMLQSPIIPHLKKGEILRKVFSGKVSAMTSSFLDLIVRKNRESVIPDIAREFVRLYNEKKGLVDVSFVSAVALDSKGKKLAEKIVDQLTDKKANIKTSVDEELIGGFTIQLDDKKLDKSVSGELNSLKLKFKN